MNKKRRSLLSIFFLVILTFLSFGFYRLAEFETVDEHFWKYDRIEKYFQGIKEGFKKGKWKKTRINDKPGVTVALFSGLGLPFSPSPQDHRDREREVKESYFDQEKNKTVQPFEFFHTHLTKPINLSLRTPVVLFNGLLVLPLLFYLVYQITKNRFIAFISSILIGLNPILIGISRIINPDAFLWGTSAVALFAFLALLFRKEKKFIFITGIATGAALLSKYTANLLFLIFPLLFITQTALNEKKEKIKEKIKSYLRQTMGITVIAFSVFALFLPAVIQKPKHFLYGTIYSPPFEPIVDFFLQITHLKNLIFLSENSYRVLPMFCFSFLIFSLLVFILPVLVVKFFSSRKNLLSFFFKSFILIGLSLFFVSCYNAWSGESIIPLNNIKELSSNADKDAVFPQFSQDSIILFHFKALLSETQNFFFSLTPVNLLLVILLWTAILGGFVKERKYLATIYCLSFLPFIFFFGGMLSQIFVNIRYGIMLYAPLALLGAIGANELLLRIPRQKKLLFEILMIGLLFFSQLWILLENKPHYFTYQNIFLPQKYSVTDTWGYGDYEVAQYLNSLPKAENLKVWVSHNGVCQFFIGKCIVGDKINLDYLIPDYFVFTRRRLLTKKVIFESNKKNESRLTHFSNLNDSKFIEKNTVFEFHSNNRPQHFIKVIKVQNLLNDTARPENSIK